MKPPLSLYEHFFVDRQEERLGLFDLLISLYAGFVSEHCSRYLRAGGLLLANDSHGDASLARANPAFSLDAVVKREGERFSSSSHSLNSYFKTRSGQPVDEANIGQKMRGPAYARQPYGYIFKKI